MIRMNAPEAGSRLLTELQGSEVVVDVRSLFVYIGCLRDADAHYLVLTEADVHDLRDSTTNRELYVHETRLHGIRANRDRVLVRLDEIVSVSRLDEVIP